MKRSRAGLMIIVLLAIVSYGVFSYYGNEGAEGKEQMTQQLRSQWSWVAASKDLSLIVPKKEAENKVLAALDNYDVVEVEQEISCHSKARPVRSIAKRSKFFAGRIIRRLRCRK